MAAIKRVTDLTGEISAASVEQSTGVAQISHAVAVFKLSESDEHRAAEERVLSGMPESAVSRSSSFELDTAA